MKTNNEILVIDFETTDDEENRHIIEIGAVLLDRKLELVDEFSSLVHPGGPVSDFVLNLTGIDYNDLLSAPTLGTVCEQWETWLRKHVPNPKRVRLAAWGNYFDVNVLRSEYKRLARPYPWSGTALDVKTLAFAWATLSGRRTDRLKLETVCNELGLPEQGRWHRALSDAKATALVLVEVLGSLSKGTWVDGVGYLKIDVFDK